MAVTLGYSGTLSNVTIAATALGTATPAALVERSADGGISYDQVRGAALWPCSSAAFTSTLNDYEFSPNEVNTYRVTPYDDENFDAPAALTGLILDGDTGDYASTPDAASLDIVGDIDLRAEITARDWTPSTGKFIIAKWNDTGNQRGYAFFLDAGGELALYISADGIATLQKTSTANPSIPTSGRLAVRVTVDVDNGAAGHDTKFYTASSIDGTWTQLGATVTTAGTTSIFANTQTLQVGALTGGTTWAGVIHSAQVLSGIGGTVVANPDFEAQSNGATSFADTATPAKTWTLQGSSDLRVPQTNTTTPTITDIWLKSPLHPFLNRTVRVVGFSEETRPARTGIFEVVGRSYPVAVTDIRSSRRYTVTIRTDTRVEAEEMDFILAAGDVMLLQTPPDTSYMWIPTNVYAALADVTRTRHGTKDGVLADFTLIITEVAVPDNDTYGTTVTWATILAAYATWEDVLNAFSDWADVLAIIGDPEDLIVP